MGAHRQTAGHSHAPRPKAPRQHTAQDINRAIAFHWPSLGRIQLWRRANRGRPGVWMHLGRFRPTRDFVGVILRRYGGGIYRCKLLSPWMPEACREAFLQQVTFELDGEPTRQIARRVEGLGYLPGR